MRNPATGEAAGPGGDHPAVGFAWLLSSQLRGVTPFDPLTLFLVAVMLFLVALVASLVPAFRAVRVHPMEALRYE